MRFGKVGTSPGALAGSARLTNKDHALSSTTRKSMHVLCLHSPMTSSSAAAAAAPPPPPHRLPYLRRQGRQVLVQPPHRPLRGAAHHAAHHAAHQRRNACVRSTAKDREKMTRP